MKAAFKAAAPEPETRERVAGQYVGAIILVRTRERIAGQLEHAAMITRVGSLGRINAMMFPGDGMPYPISDIPHGDPDDPTPCWRLAPRT